MKKERKTNYPLCECPQANSQCCGGVGPAVYSVRRKGKALKLCTRCDFGDDTDRKVLPWVKDAPSELLINFDALGAMCLAFELEKTPKQRAA